MSYRNNLRTFEQVVEQCPTGIIITDANGLIQYANPRFQQLLGFSTEEMLNQNPRMFRSGETSAETFKEMWATITAGETWHGELRNRRKSGSLYWGDVTISPIKNDAGVITHYIGLEEDITGQRALRAQLQAANEELIRSNQELKQFTSIASHDLRSPIGTISSALEILAEDHARELSAAAFELLDVARHQAKKMLDLLTDLLAFTRAGARKDVSSRVDLNAVVDDVRENLSTLIFEKRAAVRAGKLPVVTGNATLLTLLIQNLVENGLKYNFSSHPVVSIDCPDAKPDEPLTVRVSDNGMGFDPAEASHIFEPFVRLTETTKLPGTGLGLATCKRIVDIFGGYIKADSVPGQGSTFSFTIPRSSPREVPPSTTPS